MPLFGRQRTIPGLVDRWMKDPERTAWVRARSKDHLGYDASDKEVRQALTNMAFEWLADLSKQFQPTTKTPLAERQINSMVRHMEGADFAKWQLAMEAYRWN